MRITGGLYRGHRVQCPPGLIRPAMDRMRESMFSILGSLDELTVLDLFAGSGIIALEALSRGAKSAVLVEKDRGKRPVIMENLRMATKSAEPPQVSLRIQSVERFLRPGIHVFDLVHLDPPFSMKEKYKFLDMAEKSGQPKSGGTLMIHYPFDENLPQDTGKIRRYDLRRYGGSVLAFYTRDD